MEITCSRCHQTVQAENCYCPVCGLPQLVYATDGAPGQAQQERWNEATRDASSVDWKPALRAALMMAIPAGVLSSEASQAGHLGLIQRPAWITLGAGARIGLVTGLMGAWLAFAVSGGALFVDRFVLHQSSQMDAVYKTYVDALRQQTHEKMAMMGPADATEFRLELAPFKAAILSPEGHAGIWAGSIAVSSLFLLLFAVAGGALGARLLARTRRPEV
jgi:hypothetical protein